MKKFLQEFEASSGQPLFGSGNHLAGQRVSHKIDSARSEAAALLGANKNDVYFTTGATESNNLVVSGFVLANLGKSPQIILPETEHPSIMEPALAAASRFGATVSFVPVTSTGELKIDVLKRTIQTTSNKPTLVAVMHTNHELPIRNPIEQVSELCWQYGAAFHCDAVQGVVRQSIDFRNLGASTLSLSSHRMGGPRGFGILLRNSQDSRLSMDPLFLGGGQKNGFEYGSPNPIGIIAGVGSLQDFEASRPGYLNHLINCEQAFVKTLSNSCKQFTLTVPLNPSAPGIVSFRIKGFTSETVKKLLPDLCMGDGETHSGSSHQIFSAIGLDLEESKEVLRVSFGPLSSEDEVKKAAIMLGNLTHSTPRPIRTKSILPADSGSISER